ncbi:hypothetical protein [Prochlorococcus marinus]|uniref:Putative ATP synthase protein 8 n=1 Tax=Prochlorococcus marinus str. PAC1 TaxID=59924 RepID=A0A0A2C361_PROMR|nr:hypothetical protein [Prochlorococcus marinus]KGG20796.1 putative ATP synthase protein 8 precursor [Prochlorococcus marinus str. PAC1]
MEKKRKKLIFKLFAFIIITFLTLGIFSPEVLFATEIPSSIFIKKVSKSYTNKFCNAIGFGLSKESAMKFSIEENKQVFKNRKEFNNIDKDILAEEIASSVIEKCGYPINLSGEKGIMDFKMYYLSNNN